MYHSKAEIMRRAAQEFNDKKVSEFYKIHVEAIEKIAFRGGTEYKIDIPNDTNYKDVVKIFEDNGFTVVSRPCDSRSCGQNEDCSLCDMFHLFLVSWAKRE